uniref:Pre-hexon-linking protein VIII n=1 Tax=Zoothera dauma adenovirus TaxID=3073259 RepID=A0AA51NPP2_9ADEN|nr:pVIII [Zoothera dauma adenovirus]
MLPVTPYIWHYSPETGHTAGASQDYGAVINWISAGPQMYERIRNVNVMRNSLDSSLAPYRDNIDHNINDWTAADLDQAPGVPYVPAKLNNIDNYKDFMSTANGMQLSGSGLGPPDDGRQYRKLTRDALPFPYNWQVFDNGRWVNIEGQGTNALSSYPNLQYSHLISYRRPGQQLQGSGFPLSNDQAYRLLHEQPTLPRSGGMTPRQFIQQFPPIVYKKPFSENEMYFPKEFSPLFDPNKDYRRTTSVTLKYR